MREVKETAQAENNWRSGTWGRPNDAGILASPRPQASAQLSLASSTRPRALAHPQGVRSICQALVFIREGSGECRRRGEWSRAPRGRQIVGSRWEEGREGNSKANMNLVREEAEPKCLEHYPASLAIVL